MDGNETPQEQLIKRMASSDFPPMLDTSREGKILWKALRQIDYGTLGYLLSCHLIIEHYVIEALKRTGRPTEQLNWDSARLNFNQKITLFPTDDEFRKRLIPCLKHLNKLRNNFGHNITFRLSQDDLAPLVGYLKWAARSSTQPIPTDPIAILELFTTVACSYFAGYITHHEMLNKKRG